MNTTVELPKEEYDELLRKARIFDQYIESEDLSQEELSQINDAMKGPFMTKAQFLTRNFDL